MLNCAKKIFHLDLNSCKMYLRLVNTLDCKMCIVLDTRMCIQYVVANYNSYFFRTISWTQAVFLNLSAGNQLSCVMRKPDLWRHKGHVSFAVTAQLISVFVYATQIAQSLFYMYRYPKCQDTSLF